MSKATANTTLVLVDSVPVDKEHIAIIGCVREKFGTIWTLRYHIARIDDAALTRLAQDGLRSIGKLGEGSVLETVEVCAVHDDADNRIDQAVVNGLRKRVNQLAGSTHLRFFGEVPAGDQVLAIVGECYEDTTELRLALTSRDVLATMQQGRLVLDELSEAQTLALDAAFDKQDDLQQLISQFRAHPAWLHAISEMEANLLHCAIQPAPMAPHRARL